MGNCKYNGFFILLLTFFFFPLSVFAIEYGGIGGKPANPDPNRPRTKSIFIFELNPGESDQDELLVINNSKENKTLLVYATDSQKSSDGSFACEQFAEEKDNVGAWINISEEEIELPPYSNKKVNFTITVPGGASVGEENGCILIQEKKNNLDSIGGISLSFRTGLRVVVTVPGEQIRKLEISGVESLVNNGKIIAKVSVQNLGNVSIDTNVNVFFTALLNTPLEAVNNKYPILRGETAVYNYEIKKPFWGGFVFIDSQIDYDESQEAKVGIDPEKTQNTIKKYNTITIFVLPETPALIIEVIIIISLIVLIALFIKRKKRNLILKKEWSKEYIVGNNEDIESISQKFDLKWEDIAKFNKLRPPYKLQKGQKILLLKK